MAEEREIIANERFRRIELMLGSKAARRIRDSFVIVVGLGAVGSYAVEGLARAGVGKMRVVDFDLVNASNINRQLYALGSTIGRRKSDLARERILDINPACEVESINGFVNSETVLEFLENAPDLVVDAIDSLGPKVELLAAVRERNIPVISCLGAAMRTDPTKVKIAPLEETSVCHLGRVVRKRLRRRGIPIDFPCVFSDEPLPDPLPIIEASERANEEDHYGRGRVRDIMGSLPTITGIFGLTAANLAIRMLVADKTDRSGAESE